MYHFTVGGIEVLECAHVGFIGADEQRLVNEKWSDGVEECGLLRQGVAALLGEVAKEENSGAKMSEGSDGEHFDVVALVKRVV